MVGRVGYAPTTPAMSMQYSTIELTAHLIYYYIKWLLIASMKMIKFLKKLTVFLSIFIFFDILFMFLLPIEIKIKYMIEKVTK